MITMGPGHWKIGTGACDLLDEVKEARKVTDRVIEILRASGIATNHVEDNTSTNQQQNLTYLVNQHNATNRKLDVSIHFNSSARKVDGIGTEVLYYDAKELAANVSSAIATAGKLKDRGAKQRKELAFLNGTNKPAILIEVCFVSSEYDCKMYRQRFEDICQAIAKELAAYVGKKLKPSTNDKIGYNIAKDATAFRFQSGKFATKEDAVKAVEKAIKAGILSYATVIGTTK